MSSMVAAAAMRSSAASRAALMSSITGPSFREWVRTSTAESPDELEARRGSADRHRTPGSPGAAKSPGGGARHGADAISTGVRRRCPVVRGRSSESRRRIVVRGRTSGRTPLPRIQGSTRSRRAASRRGDGRVRPAGRSGVASTSRSSSTGSLSVSRSSASLSIVDGAVAQQVTEVPLQRAGTRHASVIVHGLYGGDHLAAVGEPWVRPGDQQQAREASGGGAPRPAEAVEVAAVRYEAELDPRALQLGEHDVGVVVAEEGPRQVDFDLVADRAGRRTRGSELGAQRVPDPSGLDLVVRHRGDRVARPHGDSASRRVQRRRGRSGDATAAPPAASSPPAAATRRRRRGRWTGRQRATTPSSSSAARGRTATPGSRRRRRGKRRERRRRRAQRHGSPAPPDAPRATPRRRRAAARAPRRWSRRRRARPRRRAAGTCATSRASQNGGTRAAAGERPGRRRSRPAPAGCRGPDRAPAEVAGPGELVDQRLRPSTARRVPLTTRPRSLHRCGDRRP